MKKLILFANFLFLVKHLALGQEIVSSSGEFFISTNGSLSWTLGEPISESLVNTNTLTQGFQQDYENILMLHSLEALILPIVYPNPFTDHLQVQTNDFDTWKNGKIILTDNIGRIIYSEGFSHSIELRDLPSGAYHLQLQKQTGEVLSYKLIKSNL